MLGHKYSDLCIWGLSEQSGPPAPVFSIFDNVDNHVPTAVHEKTWAEVYVDLDILLKLSIEDKFARFAVYYKGIDRWWRQVGPLSDDSSTPL